jgi:hypothetical protein
MLLGSFAGAFLWKTALAIARGAIAKVFLFIKIKYSQLVNGW